ncbi:MAG: TetR/AcrR family transcriptional regulator [bacterium]|nr:TetR/AcrR family transcriptional regulator [bacterium]
MEETTKTRIIQAVLRLMGQQGGGNFSTREILKEAGEGNLSAISYHFGSKENLLKQALQWYYEEMFRVLSSHNTDFENGRETLVNLAGDLLEFISSKPGLEKTMLSRMIMSSEVDPDFEQAVQRNFGVLKEIITRATGLSDETEAAHRVIAFMSGIVYPFLLGSYGMGTVQNKAYFQSLVGGILRL